MAAPSSKFVSTASVALKDLAEVAASESTGPGKQAAMLQVVRELSLPRRFFYELAAAAIYLDVCSGGGTHHVRDLRAALADQTILEDERSASVTDISKDVGGNGPMAHAIDDVLGDGARPTALWQEILNPPDVGRNRWRFQPLRTEVYETQTTRPPEMILGLIGAVRLEQTAFQVLQRARLPLQAILEAPFARQSKPRAFWNELLLPPSGMRMPAAVASWARLSGQIPRLFEAKFGDDARQMREAIGAVAFLRTTVMTDGSATKVRRELLTHIDGSDFDRFRKAVQQLILDNVAATTPSMRDQYPPTADQVAERNQRREHDDRLNLRLTDWQIRDFARAIVDTIYLDPRHALVIKVLGPRKDVDPDAVAGVVSGGADVTVEQTAAAPLLSANQEVVLVSPFAKKHRRNVDGRSLRKQLLSGDLIDVTGPVEATVDETRLRALMIENGLTTEARLEQLAAEGVALRRGRATSTAGVGSQAAREREQTAEAEKQATLNLLPQLSGQLVALKLEGESPRLLRISGEPGFQDPERLIQAWPIKLSITGKVTAITPGGSERPLLLSARTLQMCDQQGGLTRLGRIIAAVPGQSVEPDQLDNYLRYESRLVQEQEVAGRQVRERYAGHVLATQTMSGEVLVVAIPWDANQSLRRSMQGTKAVGKDKRPRLQPRASWGGLTACLEGCDNVRQVDATLFASATHDGLKHDVVDVGPLRADQTVPDWSEWAHRITTAVGSLPERAKLDTPRIELIRPSRDIAGAALG